MRSTIVSIIASVLLLSIPGLTFAQGKKALVIGNSDYFNPDLPREQQPGNLKNPVRDATIMRDRLESIGFDVIYRTNVDNQGMKAALEEFAGSTNQGDIGVVYFSGHGFQIKGENYLIPVHFAAKFEYQATSEALALSTLLRALEESGVDLKLVFLDCCRNDPQFRSFNRDGTKGLGEVKSPGNETLVCFATKHGEVAADNPDKENSNYTAALAEAITVKNLRVEDVMKRVTQKVVSLSGGSQQPFTYGNLIQDWYLAGNTGEKPSPPPYVPPGPEPDPDPIMPRQDTSKVSLQNFIDGWLANQFSNDPFDWASDFADSVDYCYKTGSRATHSFIRTDRQKLIDRYSKRSYEIADGITYRVSDDGRTASMRIKYNYSYSGVKYTSGTCILNLELILSGSTWKIDSYDESVVKD